MGGGMKRFLCGVLALLVAALAQARSFDVVSAPLETGDTLWAGSVDDDLVQCRAAFGDAIFATDNGNRLYLIQAGTGSRVEVNAAEIGRFGQELKSSLDRVARTR